MPDHPPTPALCRQAHRLPRPQQPTASDWNDCSDGIDYPLRRVRMLTNLLAAQEPHHIEECESDVSESGDTLHEHHQALVLFTRSQEHRWQAREEAAR